MSEHSPLPWFGWRSERGMWTVQARGGWVAEMTIGRPNEAADAEFIVRAVNSHDELLEALKAASEAIHSEYCSSKHHPSCIAADAAISKAEGK